MTSWFYRAQVDFSVLGPLRITASTGPVEIRGVKERTLLAHLVASAGRMVPTADLIESLWGEQPPRSAVKSLQTYVLRLRNALEPERDGAPGLLVTDGAGYRLTANADDIDAERFVRLVAFGRRAMAAGSTEAAASTLAEALALWRGPAYSGFESTSFGQAEGRRLEELRLSATEDRWAAELDLGRTAAVVAELERLVRVHPLRERAWALLMLALYRSGRQGDALDAYQRARQFLDDELGVAPGQELRTLHSQVLAQDPTLEPPRRPVALPAELAAPAGPTLGRHAELAKLRTAWRRAAAGEAVRAVLRGPSGAGSSRLASVLAEEMVHEGAAVHLIGPTRSAAPPAPEQSAERGGATVTLLVADHVEAPEATPHTLVLSLSGIDEAVPSDAEVIDLAPLSYEHVQELVTEYLGSSSASERQILTAATTQVLAESAGWPGRVHEAALRWGRRAAMQRIESAVGQADRAAMSLSSAREELSDGVVMLARTGRDGAAPVDEAPLPDLCPWRGLEHYDIEDGPWFCGRERLVAELVARLAGSRLLGVVGASGSGKSSAVRAGLLASLADDVLPGSATWARVVIRPGEHPMRELTRQALGQREGRIGDLLASLVTEAGELVHPRVLLVVDQLEEVWTACQDPGERAAFLDTLAELAQGPQSVTVVLVVRADYVGELADHSELAALMADCTVLVGSPTSSEIRRAIDRPASRAGLRLQDGLADSMVSDAGAEPGLLPLLSTSLTQLWSRRSGRDLTYAAYVGMGGLSGAIAFLAEEAYARLTDSEGTAARTLLLRLAGSGDGSAVTRRRVPLSELQALPQQDARRIVGTLAEARLLTVSDGHVEVAHESLFREWPRLRGWLVEDVSGRAVQRRLALAAGEWAVEGREATLLWRGTRLTSGLEVADARPEEITSTEREFLDASRAAADAEQRNAEERAAAATRQNRRLRGLLAGLGVLLAVALVAGAVAMQARSEAESSRVSADAKRLAATALNEEYPDLAMLSAIEAVRMEESPETYGALLTLLTRTPELVTRVRTSNRFLRNGVSVDGGTVFLSENEPRMRAVDAQTGEQLWERSTPAAGQLGSWTPLPSGDVLAPVLAETPMVARLDGRDGSVVWRVGPAQMRAVAGKSASPWVWNEAGLLSGGRVAFATDTHVFVANTYDGRLVQAVAWPEPQTYDETFHVWPDGRVSVSMGTGPRVFDLQHPERGFRELSGTAYAISPDGRRVALVTETASGSTLRLHDSRTYRPVTAVHALDGFTRSVAWSPDGAALVVGVDEDVQVRNGRTGALVDELSAHSGSVMDLALAGPRHDLLWTAGRDGTAVSLDLSGTRGVLRRADTGFAPHAGVGAPEGDTAVAVRSYEDRVNPAHLVDVDTGADLFGALPTGPGCEWCQVNSVAMTDEGTRALGGIAEYDPDTFEYVDHGYVAVWSARDGSLVRRVRTPWAVFGIDVSPDGRLAVLNGEHGFALLDLQTFQLSSVVDQEPMDWVDSMPNTAVSPDGAAAVLGRGERVVLVDLPSGEIAAERVIPGEPTVSLTWAADGKEIVAGGLAGRLHFLAADELAQVAPTRLVTGGFVVDLETSQDGRLVASMGSDGDVTLWDTATWRPLGQPITDDEEWGWLHFGDDRLRIFYENGTLVEVPVDPSVWLQRACQAANRDLTAEESAIVRPGQPLRSTCAGVQ